MQPRALLCMLIKYSISELHPTWVLKVKNWQGKRNEFHFCLEIKSQAVSAEDGLERLTLWSTFQKSHQPQPHECGLNLLWQSSGMQSRSGKVLLTAWTRLASLLPHFFLSEEVLSWTSPDCLQPQDHFLQSPVEIVGVCHHASLIQVSWSRYF